MPKIDKIAKTATLAAMNATYPSKSQASARVRELPVVTATELKNSTAEVIEQVVARRAVAITRHDKPRAVLLSIEEYESLTRQEPDYFAGLMQTYRGMLDRMQGPEQRAAADRLFQATPDELGSAAVWAAQKAREAQT
ncbi:MAG: type II toxin-antitoxin system Phd/YefM family antitoxin [Verrucomicrobia bacterium]|nr:type II toxin-antitoxin system Phd/YefM family antitoxin [Verrucomicrobiota bacterium]